MLAPLCDILFLAICDLLSDSQFLTCLGGSRLSLWQGVLANKENFIFQFLFVVFRVFQLKLFKLIH
jgi:hypothetical protein